MCEQIDSVWTSITREGTGLRPIDETVSVYFRGGKKYHDFGS